MPTFFSGKGSKSAGSEITISGETSNRVKNSVGSKRGANVMSHGTKVFRILLKVWNRRVVIRQKRQSKRDN
jgi:hypothetical protein